MAIYDTSTVGSISGSIGGNTFTKTGRIQRRPFTKNKKTRAQSEVRSVFSTLVNAWRELSQLEQAAWAAGSSGYPLKSRFGGSRLSKGFHLFQRVNYYRQLLGLPLLSVPGAPIELPSVTGLSLDNSFALDKLVLSWSAPGPSADILVLFFASPPMSKGRLSVNSATMKLLTGGLFSFPSPVDLQLEWRDLFGYPAIPENCRIFIQMVFYSLTTGQRSAINTVSDVSS